MFNVRFAEEATAKEVAAQIDADYAKGVAGISLAIEDGNYILTDKATRAIIGTRLRWNSTPIRIAGNVHPDVSGTVQ